MAKDFKGMGDVDEFFRLVDEDGSLGLNPDLAELTDPANPEVI